MKSIRMMAWANIKKKKGESFLLVLSILVGVTALEVALGLFTGLHQPFDTMITRTQSPHILVFYDTSLHPTEELQAWFKGQSEVQSVTDPLAIYQTRSDTVSGDQELETALLLTEIPVLRPPGKHFQLLDWQIEGDAPASPGLDEIWIPKQLAHSKDLALGDVIGIPTPTGRRDLRISGLVLDPYFSTSNITPTRCWIAPGSLPALVPLSSMTERYLGVRLHDPEETSTLDKRFRAYLGGNFAGWTMNYSMAKMAYSLFFNLISVTLLIVAVMALIIALSMMSATITSAIFAQFKQIGVLKVAGFTPKNVNAIFILQYLTLGLLAIPSGIFIGFWICKALFNQMTQSIGLLEVPFSWTLPVLVPFFLVTTLLTLGAWWTSRKAGRIQPMQAIRFGAQETKAKTPSKFSSALMHRVHPRLFLAWRNLALNPKRTFFAGLGLGMTVFVLVFAVNILETFSRLSVNKALWGESASHVTVSLTNKRFTIKDQQLMSLLTKEQMVAAILPSRGVRGTTADEDDELGKTLFGKAFDGDMDALGYLNLEGRNPRTANEIALGVNTAKKAGKQIGDTFALFLEGQTFDFEVCGIYQTANNFGEGFRIRADRLKEILPKYRAGYFDIMLADDEEGNRFKADLKQRFAEAISVSTTEDDQQQISSIMGGLRLTLSLLCLVLLGVSAVMLINDTLLSLVEHKKMFGILKTVGMTPGGLRMALALKAAALALLSVCLALPLGLILIPKILSLLAAGIGLVEFPLAVNLLGTALILPVVVAFAFGSTWLAAKPVTRIEPRQLICE